MCTRACNLSVNLFQAIEMNKKHKSAFSDANLRRLIHQKMSRKRQKKVSQTIPKYLFYNVSHTHICNLAGADSHRRTQLYVQGFCTECCRIHYSIATECFSRLFQWCCRLYVCYCVLWLTIRLLLSAVVGCSSGAVGFMFATVCCGLLFDCY